MVSAYLQFNKQKTSSLEGLHTFLNILSVINKILVMTLKNDENHCCKQKENQKI